MKKYHGSCHCGRVKFSVTTNLNKVISCNCSICTKKGVLHHRVAPEQFEIVEGEGYLSLYQFDTKDAKHFFCKECGIHPFSNPRAAPNMYSINVKCLNDFDIDAADFELVHFDGRKWEESVARLNEQLSSNE